MSAEALAAFGSLREQMGRAVIGLPAVIEALLIARAADGQVLLKGLPGLAKTRSVKALWRVRSLGHAACFSLALTGAAVAAEPLAAAGPMVTASSGAPVVSTQAEPATLRLLNRDIVTLRAVLAGVPPAKRVEQAQLRIRQLSDHAMTLPLRELPFEFEGTYGVQFMLGEEMLFVVVERDADAAHLQTLDALVGQTRARLEDARRAWQASREGPLLLLGLAQVLGATVGLVLLVLGVGKAMRRTQDWLEALRGRLAERPGGVDWRELLARLAAGCIRLLQWALLLLLYYIWLRQVLASFVATQPLAGELDDWLLGKLAWVAQGALAGLPGIATVVIVLLLTRALADVLGYFFDAVQQGRLDLPFLHPETTSATRRIVTVLVWGLGVAVAYPYLPGSSSAAFKGLSILAGVMFTLGSTGLVTQLMSGLVVVYSRALRRGDYIAVDGVQGVVTEVSALAIKVVTVRNEEVTVPNSVLISSPIRNYTKLADTCGALLTAQVTIGYDVPWRQVHAMLEEAARRTQGLRPDPAPYVQQRALGDFYVEYELFAGIDPASPRAPILSALHASIQDVFNEHGVQIMSPHFDGQPNQTVVVPKADWFKAPARPPYST